MEKINIKSSETLQNKRTREQILVAAEKLFAEKGTTGIKGIVVKNSSQVKDIKMFVVSSINDLL